MDVWQIVLYAVAALLAVRSLTFLMAAYKRRRLEDLVAREEHERRLQAKAVAAAKRKAS